MSVAQQTINALFNAPTMQEALNQLYGLYSQLMNAGKPKSAAAVLKLYNQFDAVTAQRPAEWNEAAYCAAPWPIDSPADWPGGVVPWACRIPKNLEQKLKTLAERLRESGIESSAIDPLDDELADSIDRVGNIGFTLGVSGVVIGLIVIYLMTR